MLQISAGRFFQSAKLHETPYRVYYTNYRTFDEAKITTPVRVLQPSTAAFQPWPMRSWNVSKRIPNRRWPLS